MPRCSHWPGSSCSRIGNKVLLLEDLTVQFQTKNIDVYCCPCRIGVNVVSHHILGCLFQLLMQPLSIMCLCCRFKHVVAIEPNAKQLEHAVAASNVEYREGSAEASGMADATVDLVASAQAAHW